MTIKLIIFYFTGIMQFEILNINMILFLLFRNLILEIIGLHCNCKNKTNIAYCNAMVCMRILIRMSMGI